ncbi:ABC transporter permease subunit [Bacillus sp. B1-b2]|uniref:ABC transporter permease subunit n=1 Tax=Bacillus sp. B1-b2 TaxID=2653201 RepID=UPI00126297F0|nr:ABC transporter permease subunit [Bacillus sp. B1-b2]KAB7672135.1 ABC transporter permease subunit [Bacillus sp. B1-b2]
MKKHTKHIKIGIGLLYIFLLLLVSFFPDLIVPDNQQSITRLLYNEEGNLIGKAPFSPLEYPPLGTNKIGESLFNNVIEGAKFTIIYIVLICLLRFIFAVGFSILYAFYVKKSQRYIKRVVDVAYFIPPVIIIFFVLGPLTALYDSFSPAFLIAQGILLVLIGIPPLTILLSDEIKVILTKDFISIAKLSGVSKYYLFKKHIWILIKPRVAIFFIQELIQLLFLLIHLGVLGIFIGGDKEIQMNESPDSSKKFSLSNEWAGLIGSDYREFLLNPWIMLFPLIAFTTLIIALKIILSGLEEKGRKDRY